MTGVVGSAAAKLCAQRRGYWMDGPTGKQIELKAWTMDLGNFLELVWKVEKAASSPAEAAQWLRRLYYSKPLKGAGGGFDLILNTNPSRSGAPLTVRDVPQSVLDLLVRVKDVRISWEQRPENQLVDLSHIFVLLDLRLNGSILDRVFANIPDPNQHNTVESMLSWAADLASGWLGFNKLREINKPDETQPFSSNAKSWLDLAIADRTSRNDLFGDFDAVVLSHQELPKSNTPITDLLATYYQPGRSTSTQARVADRLTLFCTRALPTIPHTVTGSGEITLSPDAKHRIQDIIKEAAVLLLSIEPLSRVHRGINQAINDWDSALATPEALRKILSTIFFQGLNLGTDLYEYFSNTWSLIAVDLLANRFFEFLSNELGSSSDGWPVSPPSESIPYYGYQGEIEIQSDGLPSLNDLEAMSQYFLNWKTPNHALGTKDRTLKPLRLIDPQGTEATIVPAAHPGTTRIRVERFVRLDDLDDIVDTPLNMELHAELLYLAADTNAARPSKKYKILMVDQENSTLTILGEPVFTGLSEWRVIRRPRIVLIDPWTARIGGDAAVLVDNYSSDRPAIKLDLPDLSANEALSRINSNFDTIRLFADIHNPSISKERQSQMYVITGVHPDKPILYLDQMPSLNAKESRWEIPMAASDLIQRSPYQMTPQDDGCDHYDGHAFIIFDGTIRGAIRCSSYTSTHAPKPRLASIAGNKTLQFQSFFSQNKFINFALMIYDSIDSTGKDMVEEAYYYFMNMTANRKPPSSDASFPEVVLDSNGKNLIRFHYGLPTGVTTESEGCLVSPEYYSLRATLVQLYNDQRQDLGLNPDEKITEIADSKTHTASRQLWQDKIDASLPDEWSRRLRGRLILVRPSQRSFIKPT